jgi:hypothetical protein
LRRNRSEFELEFERYKDRPAAGDRFILAWANACGLDACGNGLNGSEAAAGTAGPGGGNPPAGEPPDDERPANEPPRTGRPGTGIASGSPVAAPPIPAVPGGVPPVTREPLPDEDEPAQPRRGAERGPPIDNRFPPEAPRASGPPPLGAGEVRLTVCNRTCFPSIDVAVAMYEDPSSRVYVRRGWLRVPDGRCEQLGLVSKAQLYLHAVARNPADGRLWLWPSRRRQAWEFCVDPGRAFRFEGEVDAQSCAPPMDSRRFARLGATAHDLVVNIGEE